MLRDEEHMLTARQYNELYCRAFARLDDVVRLAEQAMAELEELQLAMGDHRVSGESGGAGPEKT